MVISDRLFRLPHFVWHSLRAHRWFELLQVLFLALLQLSLHILLVLLSLSVLLRQSLNVFCVLADHRQELLVFARVLARYSWSVFFCEGVFLVVVLVGSFVVRLLLKSW